MSFFDPLLLARIQFAFTVSYHILFPAFTIGLASFLAVVEYKWLRTHDKVYEQIYKLWVKVFAICFGLGVVSGIVMSYQFGTNWSMFSDKVGNVIGPLLGYEVLTAFFLEASFLGIMLFGWQKVSRTMHFTATCIVAFGTLISAFWIMAANSWMQTPAGYRIAEDGILFPTSWMQIVFNPSLVYRFSHMVLAAYLTTAFGVLGVSGIYLLKKRNTSHAKVMMTMSILLIAILAPAQLIVGDFHGRNTVKNQPAKVAAMEGQWDTERRAPFRVVAIPDSKNAKNSFEISIPVLSSLIITHSIDGEVLGLKHWKKEDRPPVGAVFWSFRVMVLFGLLMLFTGCFGLYLYFKKQLFNSKIFHWLAAIMTPSGFIALLAGWFVTEIGRQPYTAYGIIRTSDSISPVIGPQVALSLLIFIVAYVFIFGAGITYIIHVLKKGPLAGAKDDDFHQPLEVVVKKTFSK